MDGNVDPGQGRDVEIRGGDREALDVALRWAVDAGWRPGRHDARAFAAEDPAGLFSARRGGEVVTTLVAVRYGSALGYLGLYITDPAERGHGHGTALSQAALAHVSDLPTRAIDGVVERESLYASLGFRRAHLSRRWATPGPPAARTPRDGDPAIVDARLVGPEALGGYERRARAFPAPRPAFLREWLALPESYARAALGPQGEVRGYGVVRRCATGAKVAPLFADDAPTAAVLLDELLGLGAEWGPVSIDVPDPNEAGLALVRERGMAPEFACVRMYSGADPGIDLDRVFGFTSFELG